VGEPPSSVASFRIEDRRRPGVFDDLRHAPPRIAAALQIVPARIRAEGSHDDRSRVNSTTEAGLSRPHDAQNRDASI